MGVPLHESGWQLVCCSWKLVQVSTERSVESVHIDSCLSLFAMLNKNNYLEKPVLQTPSLPLTPFFPCQHPS